MGIDFTEILQVKYYLIFLILANTFTPAPSAYNNLGKKPLQHSYTFGLSREAFKKAFLREHPPRDPIIPGPGAYLGLNKEGADSAKWSMRIRPGI